MALVSLTAFLHEFGHALGVGLEPGDYNLLAHHVGGLSDVSVAEDGGYITSDKGFLMRTSLPPGVRVFPSATDVLIVAEEKDLSAVHLERVGRILVLDGADEFTSGAGRIGTSNNGGEGTVRIDGANAVWNINGPLDGRNGLLEIANRATLKSHGVSLGADDGAMRAIVDGPTSGSGQMSSWTATGDVDIGPSIQAGSGQGGLTIQNNGLMAVDGDIDVHGTNLVESYLIVQTGGRLVAGNITSDQFGSVEFAK